MVQMVASGRGVAALPRWLVDEYAARMDVVPVRLGARGIPKQIFLGAREAETGIDYVRAFIELARQPGVSTAAVALANGLNANMLRRWVREADECVPSSAHKDAAAVPAFVQLPMPQEVPPGSPCATVQAPSRITESHVQGLHGQPDRIDADQPRTSRSQAALRASICSSACTVVLPRRISTVMRLGACTVAHGEPGGTSCGIGSCTNAGTAAASLCALLGTHSSASRTQRRSMLALRPLAKATAAVETPGWRASSMKART
jgi:transposase-like protein